MVHNGKSLVVKHPYNNRRVLPLAIYIQYVDIWKKSFFWKITFKKQNIKYICYLCKYVSQAQTTQTAHLLSQGGLHRPELTRRDMLCFYDMFLECHLTATC